MSDFEPITITEIIEKDVSKPRNDGTMGSALYRIPFRLSRRPPLEWAKYFPHAWDNPSAWTTRHRPGICSVSEDRIWLNGTTIEEVEKIHKQTLQLALDETNQKYAEFLAKKRAQEEKQRKEKEAHELHISEAAKRIKFD